MIRRLRRKFVGITMLLVSLVLAAVCGLLLISTARQQQDTTETALRMSLDRPGAGDTKPEITRREEPPGGLLDAPAGHGGAQELRTVFWAVVDDTGAVTESNVDTVEITADTLAELCAEALASGKTSGSIQNPDLRYMAGQTADGAFKIVFADRSPEQAALQSMALRLAAVAAAALLALFAISLFLARMALKPVERAWEGQRQFLADASHELKTPLTIIMADTSILQAHPAETVAAQKKWVDGIQAEGARMKRLIDDLLFLARADAAAPTPSGKAPAPESRVDLSEVVMSTVLSFESVAFEGAVKLDTDVAENAFVRGDAAQLKQLVGILVDNACKYAAGDKRVMVRLRLENGSALVKVENTGPDIPPEELAHVFERFYRTDHSRVRTAGGYGLGLAIARTITEKNHGSIRAESGGGLTTLIVSLPLNKAQTMGRYCEK